MPMTPPELIDAAIQVASSLTIYYRAKRHRFFFDFSFTVMNFEAQQVTTHFSIDFAGTSRFSALSSSSTVRRVPASQGKSLCSVDDSIWSRTTTAARSSGWGAMPERRKASSHLLPRRHFALLFMAWHTRTRGTGSREPPIEDFACCRGRFALAPSPQFHCKKAVAVRAASTATLLYRRLPTDLIIIEQLFRAGKKSGGYAIIPERPQETGALIHIGFRLCSLG